MKKLLIALLLTCSSLTFADNIPCPTPTNYSFNGMPWKISFENLEIPDTCDISMFGGAGCELIGYYHPYNPVTKKLDQTSITFNSIQFTYSIAHISHDNSSEMTLQCDGNYSGEYSWFWGLVSRTKQRAMKAELLLPSTYKTCTPASDGLSFDCSQ